MAAQFDELGECDRGVVVGVLDYFVDGDNLAEAIVGLSHVAGNVVVRLVANHEQGDVGVAHDVFHLLFAAC